MRSLACTVLAALLGGFLSAQTRTITNLAYDASQLGVDCSGATDSTTSLASAIAAIPDGTTLLFPVNCQVKLSSTITITDRVAIGFASLSGNVNGEGQTPSFIWTANGGQMFDFEHDDHPFVTGMVFKCTTKVDGYLKFDGNPGTHIGTAGLVQNNEFDGTCSGASPANGNFVAIDIAPTALNNHENYQIIRNNIGCSDNTASVVSHSGAIVASSAALNVSPDTPFTSGMVGNTIWVSYPSGSTLWNNADSTYYGLMRTTIASFSDSSHVTLAETADISTTGATVHIGQSYGIGVRNGASANALQQRFVDINVTQCDYGIYLAGGSARIQGIGGGQGDYGIYAANGLAEGIEIDDYFSENDLRGIEVVGGRSIVTNSRMSNANQLADGFFKFGSSTLLEGSWGEFTPPSGGVMVGDYAGAHNSYLTSISNNFGASWSQIGYGDFTVPPTSLGEFITGAGGQPGANIIGCWNTSVPCLYVTDGYPPGASGIALQTNLFPGFSAGISGSKSSYSTAQNCSSSASPAVCGDSPAGAVAIPTGISSVTLVVNTTAVTANSRIVLMADDSLTISATTCNSTLATLVGGMAVTARTAGTSFTITYNGTIATNPLCVSYVILN